MSKYKLISAGILVVSLTTIAHLFIQYLMMSQLASWGYSDTPISPAITIPFYALFVILNPLTPSVGYIDANVIRLQDYWYYVSAICSAIFWAIVINFFVFHKLNKKISQQGVAPYAAQGAASGER